MVNNIIKKLKKGILKSKISYEHLIQLYYSDVISKRQYLKLIQYKQKILKRKRIINWINIFYSYLSKGYYNKAKSFILKKDISKNRKNKLLKEVELKRRYRTKLKKQVKRKIKLKVERKKKEKQITKLGLWIKTSLIIQKLVKKYNIQNLKIGKDALIYLRLYALTKRYPLLLLKNTKNYSKLLKSKKRKKIVFGLYQSVFDSAGFKSVYTIDGKLDNISRDDFVILGFNWDTKKAINVKNILKRYYDTNFPQAVNVKLRRKYFRIEYHLKTGFVVSEKFKFLEYLGVYFSL